MLCGLGCGCVGKPGKGPRDHASKYEIPSLRGKTYRFADDEKLQFV